MSGGPRLLLTADAVGGVWQYSLDLATGLASLGYQVTLAVLGPALDDAQRARARDCANLVETELPLEWLADDRTQVTAAGHRIAQMVDDLGADLVQLHSPALAADACFPCPVVTGLHSCVATWWAAVRRGPMPEDFLWRTDLVQRGLERADMAFAPSAAFAQAAGAIYGVTPVTVHNGRRLTVPHAPMEDSVFTAGRLWDEGKNMQVADAAAQWIEAPCRAAGSCRSPEGNGMTFDHLEHVGNLGEDAMAAALAGRPIFMSSALYEPFGLAVLEAALAGCALILSDIPTFRELWNGAATFVDSHDAHGFADVANDLLRGRERRIEAGENARRRAADYTVERMAHGMAALHARVERRVAA